jgi:serine/threonine protein kinase
MEPLSGRHEAPSHIARIHALCNLARPTAQEPGNMTNPIQSSCPKCGAPIPENAPQGLCPKCVLAGAATVPMPQSSPSGRTPAPEIAELAPHFPELEILEVIGVGGMGAVYKARQPQLDRFVALKILSHDLAGDPAFVERFNREARVLARLSHPNIVGIHDFGTAGPYCYLTMEYVDGVNLRQAMRTGGFKPAEALALVQEICSALQFAHEEGILHRDIKPENVLLDAKGRVKIADFGIAKLVGGGAASDVTLTLRGSILGTPHYMAPEQIETPGDVDQRADIYSLGVVLYEMLTGELPIGRFALPSEKAAMDARIDEIVMRTLEKARERRYQTVSELKTGFEGIEGPAVPSRAAFVNDHLLEVSKYTFWIAMIFLVLLFINVDPSLSGDTDDLRDASGLVFFLAGAVILLSTVSAVLRVMHTIRKQGSHSEGNGPRLATAHVSIPQDQRTPHLGLTATILSGISLLLAGVTLYVTDTLRDADMRMIAIVVGVSLDGTIAFLGFILGASALGAIRKSGGTKDGLGFAIFAVVAWPICLMAALILSSLSAPMPGSGGSGIPTSLAALLAGISLLLASFVLIRGLRRWARGMERKDGQRQFPGLTGTVLATLGLAILGPVLAAVVPRVFPMSDRRAHSKDIEEAMKPVMSETAQWMESRTGLDADEEVTWRGGKPDLSWKITVASGMKAELQLVLKNEDGSLRKYPIGDCASPINGSPGHARLKLGTILTTGSEPVSATQTMTALFQSGDDGHLLHSVEDLRGFHFFGSYPTEILLESPGTRTIPFATRFADGRKTETGTLSLEALVTRKRDDDK